MSIVWICCCCCVASVVSDSVRPHRWQSTRLPHPWDSPGKNTGMGLHFLLQCMKVKSKSEVTSHVRLLAIPWTAAYQSVQARVREWVAISLPQYKKILMHFGNTYKLTFSEKKLNLFWISKERVLKLNSTFFLFTDLENSKR